MKIRKGDTVYIVKGKDRGKRGKVMRVMPRDLRVVVEGINLVKKHRRPRAAGQKGEIIAMPRPLSLANVSFLCQKCQRPTRVGYVLQEGGKIRECKRCKALFR